MALEDRLVWLRPVVDAMVPVQPSRGGSAESSDPVRKYQVRFDATSASQSRSEKHAHGVDTWLFTAVNLASAAASTFVLGAPHVSVETSGGAAQERKRTVISGHKAVVEASVPFEAAVRMRVFADGEEVLAKGVTVPRGLVVELPTALVQTDNLRPVDDSGPVGSAASAVAGGGTASGPFLQGGEVVNAVDLTPTVAALQAKLRARELDPKAAKEVVKQALELLNESAFRNHSRWWLTSGLVSRTFTEERSGFQAYFRAKAIVRPGTEADARPVGMSTLRTRLDLGGGMTWGRTQTKKSAVTYQVLANVAGLVHPVAQPNTPLVKGYAPMAAVGASLSRQVSQTLQSQSQSHAIFTVSEPHVRYHHTYDIELEWHAPNGSPLFTVESQAVAETGVPLRAEAGGQPAGPAAALPYVRQVRRQSGLALPRTMGRPERLEGWGTGPVQKDGQARPPLALALRKGLGFGVGSGLPGAELVEDHLRHALKEVRPAGGPVRWDALDRLLSTHFGRPALEGNLADLMAGVQHTIDLGGERVRIRVRAHLPNSPGSSPSYPMTVNNRAAVGETATPRSAFAASLRGSVGAAPRFGLGEAERFQLTALAHLSRTWESGEAVGDEAKSYRRMETDGLVDDHRYEVVYELGLAYGPGFRTVEEWWIDHSGELLFKVTVPRQLAPAAEERHDGAGQVTFLRAWPRDGQRSLSFTGGAAGVYPAFLHITALPALAVNLMYSLNGRPAPRGTDWTQWPDEVAAATGPGELASYFGQLVGQYGRVIPLPDMDDWHQALTLRLRVDRPRALPHSEDADPTEIEQYLRSSSRRIAMRGTLTAAGFQFAAGLQERFGADSGNEIELADPPGIIGPHDSAGPGPLPGGRLMEQLYGEAGLHIGDTEDRGLGSIEVTRVTYDEAQLYRADAVFEVTLTRWRTGKHQEVSRVLRVTDGLDLLIPPRRAEDVLPVAPPVPGLPRQAAEPTSVSPGASGQRVSRGYLNGRPLHTAVYPERLEADGVLAAIIERLTARGILDKRTADAPTPLRRALMKQFRSETLETQWQALADEGVHHWFPVDEESTALAVFGGTQRHLLVSVELVKMDQAHDHRPRGDARLTSRVESIKDIRRRKRRGHSSGWGVKTTSRAGQHDSGTDEQGHGGLDGAYGRSRRSIRIRTSNRKTVDIYRANPPDDSQEFTHRLSFRVRLSLTNKLPEVLDSMGWVAGKTAAALAGFVGHKYTLERAWKSASLWSWRDEGAGSDREIPGIVRLLIPTHLTVTAPTVTAPERVLSLLPRSDGIKARWVTRRGPAVGTADNSGAPGTLTPERVAKLLTDLHPWDMPAARVIREWAKVAAERTRRVPRLNDPRTRSVPAVEQGTLGGLFYHLDTKHGRLRVRISNLLAHTHTLNVAGRTVTVGIDLTAARALDDKDLDFKSRRYQQNDKDNESGVEWAEGSRYDAGPEAGGGATEDFAWLGRSPYTYDQEHEGRVDGGTAATVEHNQEAKRPVRYYVFDVTVVMRGNGRELRVDVPEGLIAMLPTVDGQPAPKIIEELGHLFTDVPSVRALSEFGPPRPLLATERVDTATADAPAAPLHASAQAPLLGRTDSVVTDVPWTTPPPAYNPLANDDSLLDSSLVSSVGMSRAPTTSQTPSPQRTPSPRVFRPRQLRPDTSTRQTESDQSALLPTRSGDDARTPGPQDFQKPQVPEPQRTQDPLSEKAAASAEHDAQKSAPANDALGLRFADIKTPVSDADTGDGGTGRKTAKDPEPPSGAVGERPPRFTLGQRMELDELAYFSATPRAGLPGVERVVGDLRAKIPGVSEDDLEALPVTLEQNFRKMVSTGGQRLGGYLMRLGSAEVLFTVRPQNARLVLSTLADNERAPFGTEANAAMFNTGSFWQSSTVSTMPYSAGGSIGVPAGPVTPGLNFSVTANAKHHGMNAAQFVEDGQVSNHRTDSSLLTVDMNLSYRIRFDDDTTDWKGAPENRQPPADPMPNAGGDRLALWIPDRFLMGQHAKLATKAEAGPPIVPERYVALGMTGLPDLYDQALRGLRARWSDGRGDTYLKGGSGVREELRNGIDKLATNLRRSQVGGGLPGQAEKGYAIDLHEPGTAKTIATVRVLTEILDETQAARAHLPSVRMFSDAAEDRNAPIERVQTLLNAAGASNGLEQRWAAGFAARLEPVGGPDPVLLGTHGIQAGDRGP
ncbi:hypothetical protein [Streptomyces sp.]|uniref:hypothetical protein n=1 Tax=Streptomyces sp. TaxID=1931 RepID=UPI0025DD0B99|nr:hypothetical protein [Streptomyces sp.]